MSCTCGPRSDRLTPWPSHHKLLTDGESVVVDTRTHPKALILAGASSWSSRWPLAIFLDRRIGNEYVSLGRLDHRAGRGRVVWSLKPFLDWLTATYTITTKRLITREGLISRRGHDIPLLRISDVAYDMGIDRPDARLRHARDQRRQHPRPGRAPRHPATSSTCSAQLIDLLGGLHDATEDTTTPDDRSSRGARGPPARAGLEQAILGEDVVFNALEVADETGASIDQARRLWRALGLPRPRQRARVHPGRRRRGLHAAAAWSTAAPSTSTWRST